MNDLLVIADILLPISSAPIENGSVLISNGLIKDVGKRSELEYKYPDTEKLIFNSSILMPGFINAHTHLELGWIKKHIGGFDNFIQWLKQIINAKSKPIDNTTIIESVVSGIEELKKCGVTTVGEISSYNGLDKQIIKNCGLRAILFVEITDSNINNIELENLISEDLYEERPFPHAPYSCSPQTLNKLFQYSKDKSIPLAIHLAESPDELKFLKNERNGFEDTIFPLINKSSFNRNYCETPTKYIMNFNKSNETNITAVHMVQLENEDIDIIKNSSIGVILCPRSNNFLNVGNIKVDLIQGLENVGVGTDGLSSNRNLNFLEEINTLYELLKEKDIKNSAYLTLFYSTLGGAKALFIDNRIGSIETGKEADLICFNYENEITGDPYSKVLSSTPEHLRFSMVKGKFVYEN